MNLISSIVEKIFHPTQPASPTPAESSTAGPTPGVTAPASAPASTPTAVDVTALLTQMAKKHSEKLNWKSSIVDLLKVLDLDSSSASRQQLAQELNYSGDPKDSATMNIWLQKQVMNKLAENGGIVPEDLKH